MYFLLLVLIAGLKMLLCKAFALGIFLLLFWIKGRPLQFTSARWDDFFLSFPAKSAQKCTMWIYLIAAAISSVISYFILELAGYRYSLGIAVLFFTVGLAVTAYKWHTKGKDYLTKRYQEIPKTILERRERDKTSK